MIVSVFKRMFERDIPILILYSNFYPLYNIPEIYYISINNKKIIK